MAFKVEAVVADSFNNLDELISFTEEESEALCRIPIADMAHRGFTFNDDAVFAAGDVSYCFNEIGLQAICRLLNVPISVISNTRQYGLASELLNDYLARNSGSDAVKKLEFVVDDRTNTVLGTVSKTYIGYSNLSFLTDVGLLHTKSVNKRLFDDLDNFEYCVSHSVNSTLYLRLLSKTQAGNVSGVGGKSDDVSKLGLQLTNGMAGNRAISLKVFILRLLCANGMIAPVGEKYARIYHSGKAENFIGRLDKTIGSTAAALKTAKKLIEQLGALQFDATLLAKSGAFEAIISVIPRTRDIISQIKNEAPAMPGEDKEERKIAWEAYEIDRIIERFGGPLSLGICPGFAHGRRNGAGVAFRPGPSGTADPEGLEQGIPASHSPP